MKLPKPSTRLVSLITEGEQGSLDQQRQAIEQFEKVSGKELIAEVVEHLDGSVSARNRNKSGAWERHMTRVELDALDNAAWLSGLYQAPLTVLSMKNLPANVLRVCAVLNSDYGLLVLDYSEILGTPTYRFTIQIEAAHREAALMAGKS